MQFCSNDPEHLLAAARLVEGQCDAVDINLGCPQRIARRGHYGAFLMEEWDLVARMVRMLADNLSVPVTCKVREPSSTVSGARYALLFVGTKQLETNPKGNHCLSIIIGHVCNVCFPFQNTCLFSNV